MGWNAATVLRAQQHLLSRLADSQLRLSRNQEDRAVNCEPTKLFGVEQHEAEVYDRLKRAARSGESTSIILCGYSGCGKHALLQRVLWRLSREAEVPAYDVVHLSGLCHADASTALREVVRQITARRSARLTSRYVDDLNVLHDELKRRVAERSAPLLLVLSHLEAFAEQSRQTLLYVLLDATQSTSTVVVGTTTDRNVLELFEKRVRSRLHNHQVSIGHAERGAVLAMLDDRLGSVSSDDESYDEAHSRAWQRLRGNDAFIESIDRAAELGLSMRTYTRIAAAAVASLTSTRPLLQLAAWTQAAESHAPLSSKKWVHAITALPPPHLSLVLAYLRFERDDKCDYNLHKAALELHKLKRQHATAIAFEDPILLRAQAALLTATVIKLTDHHHNILLEPAQMRFAPVRFSSAVSLEDLWDALRRGDLDCPTVLRQWVLQDAA